MLALSTVPVGETWWDNRVWNDMINYSSGSTTYEATTTLEGTYWLAVINNEDGVFGVPGGLMSGYPVTFETENFDSWAQIENFTMEALPGD